MVQACHRFILLVPAQLSLLYLVMARYPPCQIVVAPITYRCPLLRVLCEALEAVTQIIIDSFWLLRSALSCNEVRIFATGHDQSPSGGHSAYAPLWAY